MSKIEIGRAADGAAVRLDLERFVVTRMLIAASSGGGKSWTIRRLLEQSHGRIQQVVLDYEGEFPTLRERFDYVLVGKGGEISADPRYAAQLCRRLLELNVSAVIDLYELKSDARHAFVKLFLEALINLPKDLWHPTMVVVDEAHVFCPEKGKGESEASGAVIDLATRGRKRGFAAVLATQDVAKLNKDASGECRNRLIGLAVEDKTRQRAGAELGFVEKEQILSLRTLEAGDFYAFGPAISKVVTRMRVGPVLTSHPEVGRKWAVPPPPREKVVAILGKLADLPKEAEEEVNELVRLRRENASLKADLKAKPAVEIPTPVRVEVPVIDEGHLRRFESAAERIREGVSALRDFAGDLYGRADEMKQAAERVLQDVARARANGARAPAAVQPRTKEAVASMAVRQRLREHPHPRTVTPTVRDGEVDSLEVGRGEQAVLTAIAQYPDGVTREQLTVLTGYKRSSRDTYVQRLQQKGLVEVGRGGRIVATDQGLRTLGPNFEPLPTGSALLEYWLRRLPEGERKVLEAVVPNWPAAVDREAISEATGYKRSSRDSYIQRLAARELVVTDRTGVKASDLLFD